MVKKGKGIRPCFFTLRALVCVKKLSSEAYLSCTGAAEVLIGNSLDSKDLKMVKLSRALTVVYAFLGLSVFVYLAVTLHAFPLFDWNFTNIHWTQAWLVMTVVDYYGSTLCLCGIVMYTEPNILYGLVWSLLMCLLGSPFACLWICLKLMTHHTLKIEKEDQRAAFRRQYPYGNLGVNE
jgi:hypothetical protein